ncbi:hypothetical protein AAG589_21050 [Isoptericola sp. F-RaC21]|uniref:hypothetical protein n=1 Tax=Isoptericola sp. F-RaC21 TaxID=3141452 RepID=UPI00315C0DDB
MGIDLEQFKDADGVLDLDATEEAARRRWFAHVEAALLIALAIVAVAVVASAVMGALEPRPAVQALLLAAGLAWMVGCRWVSDAHREMPRARRAEQLLPLALLPILLAAFAGNLF